MSAKTLMIQGTASSVGKSVLVTALCRIFKQDGFKVAPFKSQNMALNSFVTREGGEIGRAQAVQAEAAGIEPTVEMNPVLIKPEADARAQIVVMGKVDRNITAAEYYQYTPYLLGLIEKSLQDLRSKYDIVVIEGAGSPAEVNLKEREIVNMKIAKMAQAPVLLAGDIDRGGVFASLVGTLELLDPDERDLVKGFIINKFRGDVNLLKPGLDILEARTGKPVLGVVPYFRDIGIAQEDSVYLEERPSSAFGEGLDVVIIQLPHISNYDDFDPLEEMGCHVRYVTGPAKIGKPDLAILPGTKSTAHDLNFLRGKGLDRQLLKLSAEGTPLIGICGGFQILGKMLHDPDHAESEEDELEGLGLLDIETVFRKTKTTCQVKARVLSDRGLLEGLQNAEVTGYEIHMGQTVASTPSPLCRVIESPQGETGYEDGAVSENGLVWGTYLHGIFQSPGFTDRLLQNLWKRRGIKAAMAAPKSRDEQYNELAKVVRQSLDMKKVYGILG